MQFLLCFSITRNTSKVMDCTVPPGAITSVNGVRVLSMWWVILGHTFAGIAQLVSKLVTVMIIYAVQCKFSLLFRLKNMAADDISENHQYEP